MNAIRDAYDTLVNAERARDAANAACYAAHVASLNALAATIRRVNDWQSRQPAEHPMPGRATQVTPVTTPDTVLVKHGTREHKHVATTASGGDVYRHSPVVVGPDVHTRPAAVVTRASGIAFRICFDSEVIARNGTRIVFRRRVTRHVEELPQWVRSAFPKLEDGRKLPADVKRKVLTQWVRAACPNARAM